MFGRKPASITTFAVKHACVNDDAISIVGLVIPLASANPSRTPHSLNLGRWPLTTLQNTQSGTQWDGLKHFGTYPHNVFYNK